MEHTSEDINHTLYKILNKYHTILNNYHNILNILYYQKKTNIYTAVLIALDKARVLEFFDGGHTVFNASLFS